MRFPCCYPTFPYYPNDRILQPEYLESRGRSEHWSDVRIYSPVYNFSFFFDAGLVSWWACESEQKLPPPTLVKSLYMAPQPKRSTPATSAKGWKKSISKIMFCFHRLKSVYLNPWTNSAGACSYVEISNSKVCPLIRFRHYTEFWSLKNGTLINFFFPLVLSR